jgi:hypothetical protein
MKKVIGQLKSMEKQKHYMQKSRKQPTAPTLAPRVDLKPKAKVKSGSPGNNGLAVLATG